MELVFELGVFVLGGWFAGCYSTDAMGIDLTRFDSILIYKT